MKTDNLDTHLKIKEKKVMSETPNSQLALVSVSKKKIYVPHARVFVQFVQIIMTTQRKPCVASVSINTALNFSVDIGLCSL